MDKITNSTATRIQDGTVDGPGLEVPGRRPRRLVLIGAGVTAVGVLVAGPAAAERMDAFIHRAPQSAQEADRMEVFYHGRSYSWAQIYSMQADGKAKLTIEDSASYNKGQAHAFDSEAEGHAWVCANITGMTKRPVCQTSGTDPSPSSS